MHDSEYDEQPSPRALMHAAIGSYLPMHALPDELSAVPTRWVVISEFALERDRLALGHMTGNAAGGNVRSWDLLGMLLLVALRELLASIRPGGGA